MSVFYCEECSCGWDVEDDNVVETDFGFYCRGCLEDGLVDFSSMQAAQDVENDKWEEANSLVESAWDADGPTVVKANSAYDALSKAEQGVWEARYGDKRDFSTAWALKEKAEKRVRRAMVAMLAANGVRNPEEVLNVIS